MAASTHPDFIEHTKLGLGGQRTRRSRSSLRPRRTVKSPFVQSHHRVTTSKMISWCSTLFIQLPLLLNPVRVSYIDNLKPVATSTHIATLTSLVNDELNELCLRLHKASFCSFFGLSFLKKEITCHWEKAEKGGEGTSCRGQGSQLQRISKFPLQTSNAT